MATVTDCSFYLFPQKKMPSLAVGILGQSTERSSVYPLLYYTPSAFSGAAGVATLTTSTANNLPIGSNWYITVSGAVPASYNTSGNVLATVVGTWPNGQLQYASTGTGALSKAGVVAVDQKATFPQAFGSLRNKAEVAPIAPSVAVNQGGQWHKMYDDMLDSGWELHMVNGAIGSMSLCRHACGQVQGWSANTHYRAARTPLGNGDNGCVGDFIIAGGKLLECIVGDAQYATHDSGGLPIPGGTARVTVLDYIYTVAGGATGATAPDWTTVTTVGGTIVDGGVTWKCVSLAPASDTDPTVRSITTVCMVLQEGQYGFDPFGIVARLRQDMDRATLGADRSLVIIQNAQSDTAMLSAWYQNALSYLGTYFLKRGYPVAIGLSTFYAASNTTAYNTLNTGRTAALDVLRASYPGQVFEGVNEYALLGSVPGSNGLYLEADNVHPAENVHHQGSVAIALGAAWATVLKTILPTLQA